MEVIFLGTGNAFASGGRNAMAILVRGERLSVLLDCGPTTLVALKREGLAPSDVDVLLLSHHHGDHFGGIPFLLCHERYLGPREKPFAVFGPPGTAELLSRVTRSFFPGIEPAPFPLEYRDLAPDEERALGDCRFRPFAVDHFEGGLAFGYRLSMGKKTLVFSGDTAWTDVLAHESRDADLFVCECSSFERPLERHMSHLDLLRNKHRIAAPRTLLVHAGDDVIERESELAFELARDGMRVTL